jgi:septal ring factor EnvC (AmiA/AmiB activator)
MELELVNDLMKSRVSELESSEQKARSTIENLKSDISGYQVRENELYRKIDKLQDELVGAYKTRHSRSPSSSSRGDEESAAKRRKVSLSELVEEKNQQNAQQSASPVPNGDMKVE